MTEDEILNAAANIEELIAEVTKGDLDASCEIIRLLATNLEDNEDIDWDNRGLSDVRHQAGR